MTQTTIRDAWVLIPTPCTLQIVSGGRIAVCVNEVPTISSPFFVLNVFDFWNHTNNSVLYVKTLESDYTSDIVTTPL